MNIEQIKLEAKKLINEGILTNENAEYAIKILIYQHNSGKNYTLMQILKAKNLLNNQMIENLELELDNIIPKQDKFTTQKIIQEKTSKIYNEPNKISDLELEENIPKKAKKVIKPIKLEDENFEEKAVDSNSFFSKNLGMLILGSSALIIGLILYYMFGSKAQNEVEKTKNIIVETPRFSAEQLLPKPETPKEEIENIFDKKFVLNNTVWIKCEINENEDFHAIGVICNFWGDLYIVVPYFMSLNIINYDSLKFKFKYLNDDKTVYTAQLFSVLSGGKVIFIKPESLSVLSTGFNISNNLVNDAKDLLAVSILESNLVNANEIPNNFKLEYTKLIPREPKLKSYSKFVFDSAEDNNKRSVFIVNFKNGLVGIDSDLSHLNYKIDNDFFNSQSIYDHLTHIVPEKTAKIKKIGINEENESIVELSFKITTEIPTQSDVRLKISTHSSEVNFKSIEIQKGVNIVSGVAICQFDLKKEMIIENYSDLPYSNFRFQLMVNDGDGYESKGPSFSAKWEETEPIIGKIDIEFKKFDNIRNRSFDLSEDGKLLYSFDSNDYKMKIYSIETQKIIKTIDFIKNIIFKVRGNFLIVLKEMREINIYQINLDYKLMYSKKFDLNISHFESLKNEYFNDSVMFESGHDPIKITIHNFKSGQSKTAILGKRMNFPILSYDGEMLIIESQNIFNAETVDYYHIKSSDFFSGINLSQPEKYIETNLLNQKMKNGYWVGKNGVYWESFPFKNNMTFKGGFVIDQTNNNLYEFENGEIKIYQADFFSLVGNKKYSFYRSLDLFRIYKGERMNFKEIFASTINGVTYFFVTDSVYCYFGKINLN